MNGSYLTAEITPAGCSPESINLSQTVLALSETMDIASPSLHMHQLRTAYVAWEICRALQMDEPAMGRVVLAALLHDIGALAPEEKIAVHNFETDALDAHCVLGAQLLERVNWLSQTAPLVRFHHTPWQAWNLQELTPLSLEAQVIYLADMLERRVNRDQYILFQQNSLLGRLRAGSGVDFHPQVVDALQAAAGREVFWLNLMLPRLGTLLLHDGPRLYLEATQTDLLQLSLLLRQVIDFRSPYTASHSAGVGAGAAWLARRMDFDPAAVTQVEIAGNLHDLGKMAVANQILEKPERLNRREVAIMRQHPYYTFIVLATIPGFEQASRWAAYHHERLDGSGYPFHLDGGQLDRGARLMAAADVFTALSENRPYRMGMRREQVARVLKRAAGHGYLDPDVIAILLDDYEDVSGLVRAAQCNLEFGWMAGMAGPLPLEEA